MHAGVDISKATFDVEWQSDSTLHQHQFENNDKDIQRFIQQLPSDCTVVMESTGIYHARLALRLYEAGIAVCVLNPVVVKRYAQMQLSRVKSDKSDAGLIRRYAEQHELTLWQPDSDAVVDLQQAHSWFNDLLAEQTRLLNRREALQHHPMPSGFVKNEMKIQRKSLKEQIKRCEDYLAVTVKKSFESLFERLQTIPSIGPKTALELIIITDGFKRFSDVKALSAFVGVSPTTYSSGTSIQGKGTISKMGASRMRQLLYLCSWTAKTSNQACARLNERLTAMGKPRKVINVAIAHKLLRQAFAVATQNTVYSPEFA